MGIQARRQTDSGLKTCTRAFSQFRGVNFTKDFFSTRKEGECENVGNSGGKRQCNERIFASEGKLSKVAFISHLETFGLSLFQSQKNERVHRMDGRARNYGFGFPATNREKWGCARFPTLPSRYIFFSVENIQRMLLENSDGLGLYRTSMTNHSTLNCRNVLIEMIQMDFQSFLSIPGRRSETRKPLYLSTKSTGESCNYRSILNDPHGFAPKM